MCEGPFVPPFHPGAGALAQLSPLAPLPHSPPVYTIRVLCVQPPVMDLAELPSYLRRVLVSAPSPPPSLIVFPSDCWGQRSCSSIRKSR